MSSKVVTFAEPVGVLKDMVMDFDEGIMAVGGAVGVGKTFAILLKLWIGAMSIEPVNGVRRTKYLIVRTVAGDLKTSIIADFKEFFGDWFRMTSDQSPMKGIMTFRIPSDGTLVESEIHFYAFDRREETDKIKSAKYTACAIFEAQSLVDTGIISDCYARCGRTHSNSIDDVVEGGEDGNDIEDNAIVWKNDQFGIEGRGKFLILDFNYKSVKHILYDYLVKNNPVKEDGKRSRRVYTIPFLFNPIPLKFWDGVTKGIRGLYKGDEVIFVRNRQAERYTRYNGWKYWESLLVEYSNEPNRIIRDCLGGWSPDSDGKPVYSSFSRTEVETSSRLHFKDGVPVYVGVDNGFNNAWVFGQPDDDGLIRIIHVIDNTGDRAKTISEALDQDVIPFIAQHLDGYRVLFVLDQAMANREAGEATTQIDPFTKRDLPIILSELKQTKPIREIVREVIDKRQLKISPTCDTLLEAFDGGFHYPSIRATQTYMTSPKKNVSSHVAEAAEFVIVHIKGLSSVIRKPKGNKRKRYDEL